MSEFRFPDYNGQEPKQHRALRAGVTSLPSAGQRLSPDVLVLELLRECFCKTGAVNPAFPAEVQLDPDDAMVSQGLSDEQTAVIYALRGRKKETDSSYYYAPAYPEIAARAWLRRRSDRVVRDFFIRGPLAAHAKTLDQSAENELARAMVGALSGRPSGEARDILFDAMGSLVADGTLDSDQAVERLVQEWRDEKLFGFKLPDRLATEIAVDWANLCRLESSVSRLEWVTLIKTFMRVAMPCWLLSQMRITVLVRDVLRESLQNGAVISRDVLQERIAGRFAGLLVPTLTPSNPLDRLVEQYMRARVELNGIVHRLAMPDSPLAIKLARKDVELGFDAAETVLGVEEAQRALVDLANANVGLWASIMRGVESVPVWLRPIAVGQGKNIEEFLRVMRNDHVGGHDDAYLFERTGPKNRKVFRLFPAPRVLSLFVYLCHRRKAVSEAKTAPRVLLTDLEARFAAYGIDFAGVGGVRSHLISRLQDIGLLRGSPDAGDGAELIAPFVWTESTGTAA